MGIAQKKNDIKDSIATGMVPDETKRHQWILRNIILQTTVISTNKYSEFTDSVNLKTHEII